MGSPIAPADGPPRRLRFTRGRGGAMIRPVSTPSTLQNHPFAPLDADELRRATAAALRDAPDARVVSCARREPEKHGYLAWRAGTAPAPPREALVVLARPA